MGINKKEILEAMENIAPSYLAEDWDNCGIQINTGEDIIEKILLTLEITEEVIKEAIENNIDLIITHHPLIFNPIKQINKEILPGKYINDLIKNNISVYSAHTNFDKVKGGNNDFFIKSLELENILFEGSGDFEREGIGRIFVLSKDIKISQIVREIYEKLKIPSHTISVVGNSNTIVRKVAVCTGSGASFLDQAIENKCDLLITGDVKYHDAQYALERGLPLIDATHYHTEKLFAENLSNKLTKIFSTRVKIIESNVDLNPFGF